MTQKNQTIPQRQPSSAPLLAWWVCALTFGWSMQPLAWGILSLLFWPVAWMSLRAKPDCAAANTADIQSARGSCEAGFWLLLWLGWVLLTLPFSLSPLKSIWITAHYAVYAGFYFIVAARNLRARELILRLAHAACYGAALVILVGQLVFNHFFFGALSNWIACFAAAGFAASLALAADKNYPPLRRMAMAAFAALSFFAVYISRSRGALLAVMCGAIFIICRNRSWRLLAWFAVGAIAAVVLIPQAELLSLMTKSHDPFAFGRLHIWRVALDVISHNRLAGVGAGNFERGYLLFNAPYPTGISMYGRYALDAHSQPMNLAAENGVAAAFFFLVFALLAFGRALSSGKCAISVENGESCFSDARPAAMASAVFVQSLADGVMLAAPVSLLFFGMIGLLSSQAGADQLPAAQTQFAWQRRNWLILGFALCLSAFIVRVRAVKDFSGARQTALAEYYYGDSGLWFDSASESLSAQNPYAALERINHAIAVSPKNALYYYQRGRIYDRLDVAIQAETDFKIAVDLEPVYAGPAASLARLYAGRGDMKSAQSWLDAASARLNVCAASERRGYDALLCAKPDEELAQARKLLARQCAHPDNLR